jgi:hypothetical protein
MPETSEQRIPLELLSEQIQEVFSWHRSRAKCMTSSWPRPSPCRCASCTSPGESPKTSSVQARHRDLVSAQDPLGAGEESEGSQALNIAASLATLAGNNNLIWKGLFRWK